MFYESNKKMQKQSTWICLTGDGHGDVLADDKLFSISSGKSTDPVRILRVALKSFRFADGLDGAYSYKTSTVNTIECSISKSKTIYNVADCYLKVAYVPELLPNHRDSLHQKVRVDNAVAFVHAVRLIPANLNLVISCAGSVFDDVANVELLFK